MSAFEVHYQYYWEETRKLFSLEPNVEVFELLNTGTKHMDIA